MASADQPVSLDEYRSRRAAATVTGMDDEATPARRRWTWTAKGNLDGSLELTPLADGFAVVVSQRQADGSEGRDESTIAADGVDGLIHVTGVAVRTLGGEMVEDSDAN